MPKTMTTVRNPYITKSTKDEQIQRRRDFTKKLNLRRQVYREMTSYQVFPLQEMAMRDLDEKLKDYLACGGENNDQDSESDSDAAERCVLVSKSVRFRSGSASKAAETTDEMTRMRQQYVREFLKEKSIPSGAAASLKEMLPSRRVTDIKTCESAAAAQGTLLQHHRGDNHQHSEQHVGEDSSEQDDQLIHNNSSDSGRFELGQSNESRSDNTTTRSNESKNEELTTNELSSSSKSSKLDATKTEASLSLLWSMEPRIFALETSGTGKRRYISSHLGRFMDHYWRECDLYNRHYYELIREGTPCRLYFDLEFNKHANPEITNEVAECILMELFEEVRHQFQTMYGITIQRHHLVDLDSSTNKKFSRHWIFHLPNGELFNEARAAGSFVKILVARLDEENETGVLKSKGHALLGKYLLVNAEKATNDEAKLTRFIDMGVYTRNRLFRIMGSSKFGKRPDAALRIAGANDFPFPKGFCNAKFYLPEMSDSAEHKTSDSEEYDTESDLTLGDFEQFCFSHNWDAHATALECTLVVPAHTTKLKCPILPDPESRIGDDSQLKLVLTTGGCCSVRSHPSSQRQSCSRGTSPFPKLDDFVINTLGRRKGLQGSIGTYSLSSEQPLPRMISYNMLGNRWCENIGRAHKSNNIIWNVHLMQRVCWQCCHDPECRGFRGEQIDLTEEINADIDEYFLDRELSSLCINNQETSKHNETLAAQDEFSDPELEEVMRNMQLTDSEQAETAPKKEDFEASTLEEAMKNLLVE